MIDIFLDVLKYSQLIFIAYVAYLVFFCRKQLIPRLFSMWYSYSLQNPKNFRMCESFKFLNARFFYPY